MKMHVLSLIALIMFIFTTRMAGAGDCESATSTNRFDINNNGTITEIDTGLKWMRCAVGQQWDGTTCLGQAEAMSWREANDYIADLNKKRLRVTHGLAVA
jgi:hypothetical protein